MGSIHIGTQNCTNELRERLNFELRFLEEEGIKVRINEDIKGNITFFDCDIPEGDAIFQINSPWIQQSTREVVIHYIANALADIIIGNLERFFVAKIIENNFEHFDIAEREILLEKAMICLNNYSPNGGIHYLPQIERKDRVLNRILNYLQNNNELIIEGFIRFRLKDYFQELELAVEQAVEDFLMEKEYKEFIRLLKYFVEIQGPKVDEVNIILTDQGIFQILDENGHIIDNEYLEGIILQMIESDIDYEDLLISALITIAPARIIAHFREDHPVIETLRGIFESRVSVCKGCRFCEKRKEDAKIKK
ncbi:hypothetical protein BBF96_09960 [Anoxybacter fermentans]|uniref:Sporulation protein YtxC n=1 Tax=Anoxybacter fermentans TaxID=1323375 RepID=A0A3S9SZG1_9FIRM|nr:putative sporulation protein YtxC [Anoxybacter fermentans]AZR73681.1 hypothetical protein BBF96_09960 [Anoxybacter fermentans]